MASRKTLTRSLTALKASLGILAGIGLVQAQDMDVQGDGSNANIVFQAKNINPQAVNKVALKGVSTPSAGFGTGVHGLGGFIGVQAQAVTPGSGTRYGLYASAGYGATSFGVYGAGGNATTNNYGVYGTASGTGAVAIAASGDIRYTGTIAPASDARLKKNVEPLRDNLKGILQLKPKKYEFRTEEFPDMHLAQGQRFGLIAQEVETTYPGLVHGGIRNIGKDGMEVDGRTFKSVNYAELIPVLIGAIQEQQEQIEALQKKLSQVGR